MAPIVQVHWRDAVFDYDDPAPPLDYIVTTVGFLLADGPTFVSIAAEILPDGGYRAITHIPRELVLGELATLEEGS